MKDRKEKGWKWERGKRNRGKEGRGRRRKKEEGKGRKVRKGKERTFHFCTQIAATNESFTLPLRQP